MRIGTLLSISSLILVSYAAPGRDRPTLLNAKRSTPSSSSDQKVFSFPLADGFPDIKQGSDALKRIEKVAQGTLPDGALPSNISNVSVTVWQLIAFNELFEVAFFSNLIENVTNSVPGFDIGSYASRSVILNSLEAVRAQEQLHALGANGILQASGHDTVKPCKYVFPSSDFDSAVAFASTFTDIVLGTLQEALTSFGLDGDAGKFTGLVGSVIGQEGEQNGFYRALGPPSKLPSAQPFLTAATGVFALSALHQMVVVPGSCPGAIKGVPILDALNVDTEDISAETKTLQFSFYDSNPKNVDTSKLNLVYINGQNVPVVEKPTDIRSNGNLTQMTVHFPYSKHQMDGLTLAAVTEESGPFANASDVAEAAIFGPGIIEI